MVDEAGVGSPVDIFKGVIYSRFEKIGPKPMAWYPNQPVNVKQLVALKTMNIMAGDKGEVPELVSIVPLTTIDMLALVKFFEIQDSTARGGARNATLSLLFTEDADSIVHKNVDLFEEHLTEVTKIITKIEAKNKGSDAIDTFLENFHSEFCKIIQKLLDAENKIQQLQKTIQEVQALITEFAELGASRQELAEALKFSFELSNLDLASIDSQDIRKIKNYAAQIKEKKKIIMGQQKKLRTLRKQLDDAALEQLEEKLSLIASSFDSYISAISERIAELSDRGTTMLFFRTYKGEANTEQQISAISSLLKNDLNFISKCNNLSGDDRERARKSFISYLKTRSASVKSRAIQDLSNLIFIPKDEIKEKVKDKKIEDELRRLFNIKPEDLKKKPVKAKKKKKKKKFKKAKKKKVKKTKKSKTAKKAKKSKKTKKKKKI
ncbi:MAG: coiled-coil domain-containing protein [Candidatus Helarchaeota archaeon]